MSSYFLELESESKAHYLRKLNVRVGEEIIVIPDPYSCGIEWEEKVNLWPPIEFGDIYVFLIDSKSRFSKEKLKAYKSLEAYNYYASGLVRTVRYFGIQPKSPLCVLRAEVRPGQKANASPYVPWVIANKKTGEVLGANCTCMAGLGEVCSHVAALLFKVEAASSLGYLGDESCTSKACVWNKHYSKKVQLCKAEDLDFSQPRRKERKKKRETVVTLPPKSLSSSAQEMFLAELKEIAPEAAVFVEGPFSDTDTASECGDEGTLPPLILDIFRRERKLRQLDTPAACELLRELRVTDEQREGLERATVGQRRSNLWQDHRKGRVTASMAHKLLGSKACWDAIAKCIVNGGDSVENIPAVKWGIEKEECALQTYRVTCNITHSNFVLNSVGLFIGKDYPFLGASPDGLRHCSCHGTGLVEVKCPYRFKDVEPFGPHTNVGQYFLDESGMLKKEQPVLHADTISNVSCRL